LLCSFTVKPAPAPHLERLTRPPLERMLKIHEAVKAGGFPNQTSLGVDLEVSTKTVQRDLEFMRDRMNLPLEFDRIRNGYYYEGEVGSLPSVQISEGELLALLVAEKSLQQYRGTSFEKPLAAAFKKLAASLPENVTIHLADWDQTISFRTSAESKLDLKTFDTLAKATAERKQLRLTYRKPGKKGTEPRVVDPYHLANINGEWFLFAHCHLRNDIRTFVPARIENLETTGKTFQRPAKFSLEKRLRDSFGVVTGAGEFNVLIRFDDYASDYIREKRWHASQTITERADGGLDLRLKLSSLEEVQRWVLGWGGRAVPVEPKELVEGVRRAAERMLSVT
jgi:predicted DNA-binding transcriptional regulator YafY